MRLVQNDEVDLRRIAVEERDGADVVPMEVGVGTDHLLQEMMARRDPANLQLAPEPLLETVHHLQGHVGLAAPDWTRQHDGRLAGIGEGRHAGRDRLLLITSLLVDHQATFPPKARSLT